MTQYDNTNRGVLFANYQREDDGPEYSGKLNVQGEDLNLLGKVESDTKVSIFTADGSFKGSLEKVDKEGKSEKYPDWKGNGDSTGSGHYQIAAWKRTSKKGAAFLSISIEGKSGSQVKEDVVKEGDSLPF